MGPTHFIMLVASRDYFHDLLILIRQWPNTWNDCQLFTVLSLYKIMYST